MLIEAIITKSSIIREIRDEVIIVEYRCPECKYKSFVMKEGIYRCERCNCEYRIISLEPFEIIPYKKELIIVDSLKGHSVRCLCPDFYDGYLIAIAKDEPIMPSEYIYRDVEMYRFIFKDRLHEVYEVYEGECICGRKYRTKVLPIL